MMDRSLIIGILASIAWFALFSDKLMAVDKSAPLSERIVLVGDSTVATRSGWGDAFSKLLAPGIKCLNLARGGRSSKSYRDEGHWLKVLEAKPSWILIQFGHNEIPGKGPKLEMDAKTTFRENLTRYIVEARVVSMLLCGACFSNSAVSAPESTSIKPAGNSGAPALCRKF